MRTNRCSVAAAMPRCRCFRASAASSVRAGCVGAAVAIALAASSAAPTRAHAQVVPGEIVPPGETLATTVDADAARINPGAIPLARDWSARFTHVSELRAHDTALNADALSATVP